MEEHPIASLPHVTVIVPVWNQARSIAKCLRALQGQDYPSDRYDICVVDNGSTDATAETVRGFPSVALLLEPAAGSYAARNRGLAAAVGSLVVFTDADCIPDPSWLTAAVRNAQTYPEAGIIGGQIDLYRAEDGGSVAAAYERLFAFRQKERLAAGYCTTANWLSPRVILEALGGFDATLRSGGDFALCERVRASGATMVYAPDMIVRHPARESVMALSRKRRRTTAGIWQRRTGTADRVKLVLGTAMSVWREVGTVMAAPDLTPTVRIGVAATVVWLSAIQLFQIVCMVLGGAAPRD